MKKLYLLPVLLLLAWSAIAQTPKLAKADKYYQAYQFAAAAKAYEKVLKSAPGNVAVMARLVQCYLRLADAEQVKYWLEKALEAPLTEAKHYRALAAVLAMDARYTEAGLLYAKAVAANDLASVKWQQAYQDLSAYYEDSLLYEVSKAPFNSAFSDFSPAFFGNGVVFSSSRSNKEKANQLQENYTGFVDLFYAAADAAGPVAFSAGLNSQYHEGPLSFTASQDTVYFTRSNFQKKSVFSKDGVNNLKIYYAVREHGQWQHMQALPLNNDEYSVGHPALANSHTLYFVSDMPGGYGGTDLYKTVRLGGVWQAPVNLGPEINTTGNEMFPFVDEQGALYFASTGHVGLGGLDIFYAPRQGESWGPIRSAGHPINTPGDDFGLVVKGDVGYYSSNYQSAHDDIYAFKVTRNKQLVLLAVDQAGKPLRDVQLEIKAAAAPARKVTLDQSPAAFDWTYGELSKLTLSKKGYATGELNFAKTDFFHYNPLDTIRVVLPKKVSLHGDKQVAVVLQDEEGKVVSGGKIELMEVRTGARKVYFPEEQGSTILALAPGRSYQLRATKPGYRVGILNLGARQIGEQVYDDGINLALTAKSIFEDLKVGESIDLAIEYDLDKAGIRPEAAQLLDKLVAYLHQNAGVAVELSAHTDSRGADRYNQALSQRRAEAAVAYIAAKGINANRMVAIGYGEKKLKVANARTDAQHQANRRTTVRITANRNAALSGSKYDYMVASKSGRYFVVVGGFSGMSPARRKRSELVPKTLDSKIVLPYEGNKVYRVTVADFAGKEEALEMLPELKKRFGNSIWVLRY